MDEIQINPELRDLIPPLQLEEKESLEKSILEEGCRDKLITWDKTIIDGHNRYEICKKHNIPFQIESMNFRNISEVKNWMIDNQLARRNLTDSQRRYFIGKRYEEEKKTITNEKGINQHKEDERQSVGQPSTSERIAKENNISHRTVERNADYSKAIDRIREEDKEVANKILSEEIKLTNKDVLEIAKDEGDIIELSPEEAVERKKVFEEIKKGTPYREIKKPHVSHNSGNNEWYTPVKFLKIARSVMGSIDTDPASSEMANRNVKATTFYTEEDDGLKRDWAGNIWLNPPYAQPAIQNFSDKLIEEIKKGNVKQAMVLVNNATETKWFNTLSEKARAIWFPRGRIRYLNSNGSLENSPLQGQAILYYGNNVDNFINNCEGLVCRCGYA